MTLTKTFSFLSIFSLPEASTRPVSLAENSATDESHQKKIEAARCTLETELPKSQRNLIRYLDC